MAARVKPSSAEFAESFRLGGRLYVPSSNIGTVIVSNASLLLAGL
jgi:hypothetical protein